MAAITIRGRWWTTADGEALWRVVTDLRTWPVWWPAIDRADVVEGTGEAPDEARLTFGTPAPLRPLVVTLRVVERAPSERLVVELSDGPMSGHGTVAVAASDTGAVVTYDVALRIRSLLFKPLEPILAGATRSGGRERLAVAGDDLARLAGGELVRHDT